MKWFLNRTDEEIFYLWSMVTLTVGLVVGCYLGAVVGFIVVLWVTPSVWITVAVEYYLRQRRLRKQKLKLVEMEGDR